MTKEQRMQKNIRKFLSLFNVYVSKEDKEDFLSKLYNGELIYLYNDSLDAVGQMTFTKDGLNIYCMNKDYIFSAVSMKNDAGLLDFEYQINEIENYSNCIKGKYLIEKGSKLDGILLENIVDIYENGNFVGKCVFDTLRNYFYMYDAIEKQTAKYRNNEFRYENKEKEINITHEKGNIMYEVNYLHRTDRNVYGNKIIPFPLPSFQFYKIEKAIEEIIQEFDSNYFEMVDNMKEKANNFNENLFENLACSAIKNFDRKQLESMLKIEFIKFKGKSKTKK